MTALGCVPPPTRGDLVRWLAVREIVPVRSGRSSERAFTPERRGPKVPLSDRERRRVVRRLGVSSDGECERTRERIKSHPAWGACTRDR